MTITIPRRKAAEWEATDPVLRNGEPGIDKISNRMKVGDGKTRWSKLPWLAASITHEIKQLIGAGGGGGASTAAELTFTPVGALSATDVQAAIAALESNKATPAQVSSAITTALANLVNGAPDALNTWMELVNALSDNEDAVASLTTLIGTKASTTALTTAVADLTTAIGLKASTTVVDAALATLTSSVAAKASQTALDTLTAAVAAKAATTYVDSAVSTLNTALAAKATPADITTAIDALKGSAPTLLDTLAEIAVAIQADESAAAALTSAVALKAPLASPLLTGTPKINGVAVPTAWKANTDYLAGQWVIAPGGYLANAKVDFTSGSSYVSTNWNEIVPGRELGYAERDTTDTTTNTSTTDSNLNSNLISGLSILGLIGTGTPVDIKVDFALVLHSVVGKAPGVAVMINGVRSHSSQVVSNSTTSGTFFSVEKRVVLPAGVSHDIAIGKFGSTGTSTYYADSTSKMSLKVTQR